jgi:hypothetical protein
MASGGPSFAVAVLDTQEFYQGITQPITGQIIDFLLNEGYSKSTVFYLLYWLHDEQPKTGRSLPTLALLRGLLALNTSAKALPATTTLSIVAP